MRIGARRTVVGAAALAVLASGVLVATPVSASTTPDPSTPITDITVAQAVAVLRSVAARTDARMLASGGRIESSWTATEGGRVETAYLDTMTVDVRRRTARLTTDIKGEFGVPAVYIADPCSPGSGTLGRRHYRDVVKEGSGTWRDMKRRTSLERTGLRLLDRPGVRWEKHRAPRTTLERTVKRSGFGGEIRRNVLGSDHVVEHGSFFPTGTGKTYLIAYREDYEGPDAAIGRIRLHVDAAGVLVSYEADERYAPFSDSYVTRFQASYGARRVTVPSPKRTIRDKSLATGCRAAFTRELVPDMARAFRDELNDRADRKGQDVTVERLRRVLRERVGDWTGGYDLSVTVTDVRGGVAITGRHRLLAHPVVSTVFVRDGRAVLNDVR